MIWYLLYPFRGTTEPPVLQPNHPVRQAFTKYGREAARHTVITLLISVAIAVILIYPFPFLYTNNFTNGSSNLPHHVWTAAQPFDGDANILPDVVMRTVWVHGSYMNALNRSVLQTGLEIQNRILGTTNDFNPRAGPKLDVDATSSFLTREQRDSIHAANGISDIAWFFHSPLLYWSGSAEAVAHDADIISTVNKGSKRATTVNVTLRHSIVFSGKRFEDHKLVAADALVITLVHKLDSPVGRQWERECEALARDTNKWRVYPADGRVLASHLYDFKFQPLSLQDDVLLTIAYLMTLFYFVASLTKLRAMKSRTGLTITVISQVALSLMSSFTVCAVFKIDLSRIPREAYPLVVLTIGMENMFRLINAVIITPTENATSSRIAEALGQAGPIALAGVTQNLFLLWLLKQVVAPSVASFCVFVSIALSFDFFYLLTFFVAVLGIDVRRTELSDSMERAVQDPKYEKLGEDVPDGTTWTDLILLARVPISTRIAGTVVMVGFVLLAQWHFFENEHPTRTLSRLLQLFLADHKPGPTTSSSISIDVNQARSPLQWLRLQDHETAREVIQVVKPGGHNYIARVYDPLVIVLAGSNRAQTRQGIRPFLPAVYDFARHQSTPFVVTILFAVAAVSLLMNYFLWGEEEIEEEDEIDHVKDDGLLGVKTLAQGHALDIAMLEASPAGVIVTVGLDRWIRVWDIRRQLQTHVIDTRNVDMDPFPLIAITIDDSANWIGLLSVSGKVCFWSIPQRRWGPTTIATQINRRKPINFSFKEATIDAMVALIIIRANGVMTEIKCAPDESLESVDFRISKGSLVCAKPFWDNALSSTAFPNIVTTSKRGSVQLVTCEQSGWRSEELNLPYPDEDNEVGSVVAVPQLHAFLAVRRYAVDLIDLKSRTVLHTFERLISHQSTVSYFLVLKRKTTTGISGVVSFSMVYTDRESGDCVVRTYVPINEGQTIRVSPEECLDDPASSCSWSDTTEQFHRVQSPGEWTALPCGVVVGVRKKVSRLLTSNGTSAVGASSSIATLRRRVIPMTAVPPKEEEDIWETWMMSSKGESITMPIPDDENNPGGRHLFATSCGPMSRVGRRSIAVGLGNVPKVITIGNERFDGADNSSEDMTAAMANRRKKLMALRKRSHNNEVEDSDVQRNTSSEILY